MKRILLSVLLISYSLMGMAGIPVITSFTPSAGPVGTLLTITGTDLSNPTAFSIGGVNAIVISNTGSSLVGMVMPGALTGTISLTTADGNVSSSSNFTISSSLVPNGQLGTKLVAIDNAGAASFGFSVALSADGRTAVVGGNADNANQGAAWVYIRNKSGWTQQGTKLKGSDLSGKPGQGQSVAINADGNTIIVGANTDNGGKGAAAVYIRSGNTWTQQGTKLVGTDITGSISSQGHSVAISADGNTAMVGGISDNTNQGAVWMYTRSADVWTQQGSKLVGTGNVGNPTQGYSIALSADGNTAMVGGPADNSEIGAVWVYTRSGGIWTQQGNKIIVTGGISTPQQGSSVSLSADGNTAIIGGYADNGRRGAVWVYTRSGSTWTQESKLTDVNNISGSIMGFSASLSADANTAMIGGMGDNINQGGSWIFTRSGGVWTLQGSKMIGSGGVGTGNQGRSVAISADGSIAIMGGNADNTKQGAVWTYKYLLHDATLSALTISSATLSPAFSSATTTYTSSVDYATNNITVTPSAADSNATTTMQVNGAGYTASGTLALNVGTNIVDVKVTAEDGTTIKIYTITISRTAAPVITSFTPASGTIGTLVTITGTDLTKPSAFTIGGVNAIIVSNTGSRLVAMVMPGAANGNISFSTGDFTAISGSSFTVTTTPPPNTQLGSKLLSGTVARYPATLGFSIALSADGRTALVSAPIDEQTIGSAWVYTSDGSVWTAQTKLTDMSTPNYPTFQAYAIALSADGNTAVLGGYADKAYQGAIWIYTRNGSSWTLQRKISGSDAVSFSQLGYSVAISADGNTVIAGGSRDNNSRGAVWTFIRNGNTWTQQGTKLVSTGGIGNASFGSAVSLSADGKTAIVGGPNDNVNIGAAWAYTMNNGNWILQGKLVGTGSSGFSRQGCSTSLSADGNTAIVGGYSDNSNQGGAWIFTRSGNTWTQQGGKLLGTGNIGPASQGNSVSLSADGNIAVVGGPTDNIGYHGYQGATWTFTRSGNTWTQQEDKLLGTGITGDPGQGQSVAISADAKTTMVGGYRDDSGIGAVWVYTYISHNARLSALAVSQGILSPAFDSATITYTDSVDYAITDITVTPTLADSTAAMLIQINGGGYTASGTLALNVGNNTIDIQVTAPDGTTIKTYTITVTRARDEQLISFAALANHTYGDADFNLTATGGASANPVTYISSNPSVATISGNTVKILAAGTTTITASQAGNTTYNPAPDSAQSLTIDRKVINVTADPQSKTYGDTDPVLTYTSTLAANAFTGVLSRTTGENTGDYTISQNTLALNNNYTINYTAQHLTINPKTIVVTAVAKSKIYGDADPLLTYTSTPALITGDSFTGVLARIPGENTGTYNLTKNTLALSSNYVLNYTSANLTIGVKTISVTADVKSKTYGDADPILTYTLSPSLISGDTFTGELDRTSGENAGTYTINKSTLALGTNYVLNYTPANLTIGVKTVTVTASAKSKTYGDADPSLTYTVSPSLISGDAFTGVLNRAGGENVGTYMINKNTLALNANYVLNYTSATLAIGTKTVTVTANSQNKIYGNTDPLLTYSSTPDLITGDKFTGSLGRVSGENVGPYAINKNTLTLSNNYVLNYTGANLIIGTKTITVTADPKSKSYGDVDPSFTYTSAPALTAGDHFTGLLSRSSGEGIGTYVINRNTLSLSNNYVLNYVTADLTIGKKTISVRATAQRKTYGDNDPSLTYTFTPALATGDSFTGSLDRSSGQDAGTYTINKNTLALGADYILNYTAANLVISKKSLTISADNKSREYSVANPILTAVYSSFAGSENETVLSSPLLLTTTATINSLPGDYPITASGASALNYSIQFVNGILHISGSPQSIDFSALADKLSTDAIFTLTATATSGLTVSYSSSDVSIARIVNNNQVEILKAGTVSISASQSGNTIYEAAIPVSRQLTIIDNPAPVIVIQSDKGNSISRGETAILTASGAETYQWETADSIISGQATATLTIRPSVTTTYTVTGTNQYGRSSTQTFTLEVKVELQALTANNIVTPNGDGINDYWIVKNIDMYPNNEVTIFDRRGKIVYSKKGYDNSWGGMLNGVPLPDDTYYYVISIDGAGNKKGFITVVR